MAREPRKEVKLVEPAVELFVDNALRRDDSLFTPGRPIWSLETLNDLHRRFVERPDESGDTFERKWERQLADAPAATIQLAAECLYVYFLVPHSVRLETKRRGLETVLSWSPDPAAIPGELVTALEGGIVRSGGAGYHTYKPSLIAYLIELAQKLKSLDKRGAILDDPGRFRELAHSFSVKGAPPMREALLYFVHPDSFEPIVSSAAKKRIASAFAEHVSRAGLNLDEQLLEIRRSLAEQYGPEFEFYASPVIDRWQPEASRWGQFVMWAKRFHEEPNFDADERDDKLVIAERIREARRALRDGEPWHELLQRAFASPNNLTHYITHQRFLRWVTQDETGIAALEAIWNEQATVEERIRGFCTRLPQDVVRGTGTRLNLAGFLNLAHDPESEPPYQWTSFRTAFQLTDSPFPAKDLDEAAVYRHALDFLDTFNEKAAERGLDLRDRLDAQGAPG
ncbi:MAG: hypothetical protein GY856_45495 [bacterium]|nr:hypothetical protein [bacterium]